MRSPGPSAAPTGRISSPVGMIATAGLRATSSVVLPGRGRRGQIGGAQPVPGRDEQLTGLDVGGGGKPLVRAVRPLASQRGTGREACTGATVTRPSASWTGTCSAAGCPRQPASVHMASHRA